MALPAWVGARRSDGGAPIACSAPPSARFLALARGIGISGLLDWIIGTRLANLSGSVALLPAILGRRGRRGLVYARRHAGSRHRRHFAEPDRSGVQGHARRHAARRPDRSDSACASRQGARARPRRDRGPDARQRAARRRGGLQPRPGRGRAGRARPRPRRHGEPLLLVVAPDDPHGGACDPGRRGRRVRGGWCGDGEPFRERKFRRRPGDAQRVVRRGRGTVGDSGRRWSRTVDPTGRPSRHLHRDGADRRERRGTGEHQPRRDGRVRRRCRRTAPWPTSRTASSRGRSRP